MLLEKACKRIGQITINQSTEYNRSLSNTQYELQRVKKKKSTSLFDRFLLLINFLVVMVLLVAYILPYISPIKAPILAVVSLLFLLVFVINTLFIIFWVIRRKRYAFLSTLAFAMGFDYINSMYKLSGEQQIQQGDLSLMSYNVRMFNHYQWILGIR